MKIDKLKIQKLIDEKLISVDKHPDADLYLYNYTKECQFQYNWTPETMMCRGLITDGDGEIVSRPFPKFFNYSELQDKSVVPVGSGYKIYEKLDGSLGILYWIGDTPYITTRGKFTSPQGRAATKILHKKYSEYFDCFDRKKTYLFEIIIQEDPHVVLYPGIDDIYLIGIRDTESGQEYDLSELEGIFPTPTLYSGISDFSKVCEIIKDDSNKEGFVVLFDTGFRVKIKYQAFLNLQAAHHHLTRKAVLWQLLFGNEPEYSETIQAHGDPEITGWYETLKSDIQEELNRIKRDSEKRWNEIQTTLDISKISRKEIAEEIGKTEPSYLIPFIYNLRDGKDLEASILKHMWKNEKEPSEEQE